MKGKWLFKSYPIDALFVSTKLHSSWCTAIWLIVDAYLKWEPELPTENSENAIYRLNLLYNNNFHYKFLVCVVACACFYTHLCIIVSCLGRNLFDQIQSWSQLSFLLHRMTFRHSLVVICGTFPTKLADRDKALLTLTREHKHKFHSRGCPTWRHISRRLPAG